MRCVVCREGQPVVTERPVPVPSGRQLLIKVHATALNRADLMQAKGSYPPPPGATDVLGLECSGEVSQLGPDASLFAVGARVMALLEGGGYGEHVLVDERQVMPMAADQSFASAAAVPEAWLTAYQLLHLVAKVKPCDVVLVHAGASGVGTAAIQLARAHGVQRVFVTAGSDAKIELCQRLGAELGVNYKTRPEWHEALPEAPTVVLDCIGYPYVERNCKAIAVDGRWVLFGLMGGPPPALTQAGDDPNLLRHVLIKRVQLLGTTLRARPTEYKAELVEKLQTTLAAHPALAPVLDAKSFAGLDSIAEAHAYMASNQSQGKIILSVL